MRKVSRLLSHGAVCVNSANLKAALKHIHVYFKGQYFKKKTTKKHNAQGIMYCAFLAKFHIATICLTLSVCAH